MKFIAFLLLLTTGEYAVGQTQDNDAIKKCITLFFDGMAKNDTNIIKHSLDSSCFLYSVMKTKSGKTILEEESVNDFFRQVIELKGNKADEQLLSYDIKIDGAMAIAWTPYKFYFNDKFSHCGVNVFTLIRRENEWKIMGITDTRRKQGCE
ncbi:MAG: nuclear transport factor 2 family protein [Ferruginibacter sp.]